MQCNIEDYITTVNYYHSSFNKRVRKIKKDHLLRFYTYLLCAICDKKLYIIVFLAVTSPLVISMFEDMKINTNTSIKMDMKVTCTFFTWPLPLFDTDMDMDIIKDIDMNEHLHVYE